jgi:hypothetical protein
VAYLAAAPHNEPLSILTDSGQRARTKHRFHEGYSQPMIDAATGISSYND